MKCGVDEKLNGIFKWEISKNRGYLLVSLLLVILSACSNEIELQSEYTVSEKEMISVGKIDVELSSFAKILEYYASLQQRANTTLPIDEQIFLETISINNPSPEIIVYSLYDISGNGIPELIIGVENRGILRIYTLQDNEPVLLISPATKHFKLNLLEDVNGNTVIEHSRRRQFLETAEFYRIDEYGELVILDVLLSSDKIPHNEINMGREMLRERVVHGEMPEMLVPEPETIVISEEEYISLMEIYGSGGWLIESQSSWEEREEAQQLIELDWQPVLEIEGIFHASDSRLERLPTGFFQVTDDIQLGIALHTGGDEFGDYFDLSSFTSYIKKK